MAAPGPARRPQQPETAGRAPFFASRWRGDAPLRTVLWRDMLAVGTVLNLLATFAALMAASQGSPAWLPVGLHLAPLPYNLFLFTAVVRSRQRKTLAVAGAATWLAVMTIV